MKAYRDKKDDVLVEMTLLGSEQAYEELVTRHQNAVKGTAYKVTGNEFSAEDASQDAFVAAWMHLDSLRERERFGSWVCSIAKNCARQLVTHYKSCAPDISLHLLQDMELTALDESGLLDQLGFGNFAEAERDEQLHAAVDALSEKIREAIRLHYFEGLSVSQIAERLSVPEGTVKWRLCEGRKQLRKEYGVMEKTYNENESLVERVMRQVEALKLWRLKNDKTGFEEEYRAVLAAVESLEDSKEKHHALADVLLRGAWWLPGKKSDELQARIKGEAEKGHNDDVMMSVMCNEHDKFKGQERVDFMRDTQNPYLEEHGFVKTLAYNHFWMGHDLCELEKYDEGITSFARAKDLLTPMDVYYANAISAIHAWKFKRTHADDIDEHLAYHATGEEVRYIGNKLYFWQQPGFSRGGASACDESLLWNCSQCDNLIYDPDMKPGEMKMSSDGKFSLALKAKNITVTTLAGTFEHCDVVVQKVIGTPQNGLRYTETTFCPGVGIVHQYVQRYEDMYEWQLSAYEIHGGEGVIPFTEGNVWDYVMVTDIGTLRDAQSRFAVTGYEDGKAVLYHYATVHILGYDESTWKGNILQARQQYYHYVSEDEAKLRDVAPSLQRAAALAATKRQKVHTAIAADVMHRIFDTDSEEAPERTQAGFWNFFDIYSVTRNEVDESTTLYNGRTYSFEWKNWIRGDEGYKVLNNFVYDILNDAVGCVWSDKWVPGYHKVRKFQYWHQDCETVIDVTGGETVVTPAGTFENCLCMALDIKGMEKSGVSYRGGKKRYWFAHGVGIVRYTSLYKKDTKEATYLLTEMRGTGVGYFPCNDGLFRRYEVLEIENGWHGAVEYTWDEDEEGTVIFRNATGTQDVENYKADQIRFKKEDARKKAEKEAQKAEEQA